MLKEALPLPNVPSLLIDSYRVHVTEGFSLLFFFKLKPGQRKQQRRKPKQRNRKPQSRPKSPNRQNPPKNQKRRNPQRSQRCPRPPRNQKEQPQRSPTLSVHLWGAERRSWPLSWAGTHVRKLENTLKHRNAELSVVSGSCLGQETNAVLEFFSWLQPDLCSVSARDPEDPRVGRAYWTRLGWVTDKMMAVEFKKSAAVEA